MSALPWAGLAVLCIWAGCCLYFLRTRLGYSVPIADISRQIDGRIVVTSHGAHRLLRGAVIESLTFHGTGVPWLDADWDHPRVFEARQVSKQQFLLVVPDDETRPVESSMGWFHISWRDACSRTGYSGVPLGICVFSCAGVAMGAAISSVMMPRMVVSVLACLLPLVLIFFEVAKRTLFWRTPIHNSRTQYLKQLRLQVPVPIISARGAGRGMTLEKLSFFQDFFQSFIRERSMYYVSANQGEPCLLC
mmetsp:Transcript_8882/g.21237  ORF Transcript_8882/g.21237 Transcript_8882/m.21237 type:complete len:248 (-) Transcript_8882:1058-1801(-)